MSKAFKAILLIFLVTVILPNCHGLLKLKKNGRIVCSVFTPYKKDGNVNLDAVPKIAKYLAERNVKNVQILGFYGQGPIIDLESRKALIRSWVKQTDCLGLNLYVEIGGIAFTDQLKLAKFCSQLNVSAISAFPELVYEAKTKQELINDYRRLSDAAPKIPLLYRTLTVTGPQIPPTQAIVDLIGRVKTFVGGVINNEDSTDIKGAVPSVDGYQLWIYSNKNIAPALITNNNVSVTNIVNLCPKLALDIEAAVDAGKIKKALDLQQQINRLIQAIVSNKGNIIDYNSRTYIRYVRAVFRLFSGIDLGSRLPFERVNSTELNTIRRNLRKYQDFIDYYCS